MTHPTLYLTDSDISSLVDLNEAIDALQAALLLEAGNDALSIPKALGLFGASGSLHSLGSAFPGHGLGGFKTWVNTGTAGAAVMVVFDLANARVVAILEAGVLGQLRTAAISGVATRALARADASDMALVGTGRQAMMQLAAVAAVRPLKRVRVFSPTPDRRRDFVAQARATVPFDVVEATSVREATDGVDIVTLVTRARTPFLERNMLASGAHLNAVGAILPQNAEFAQDVFDAAALICVDSIAGVQDNSSEFRKYLEADASRAATIVPLGKVLASALPRPGSGITLFKAMGMGISDLAVARLAIERARESRRWPANARPQARKRSVARVRRSIRHEGRSATCLNGDAELVDMSGRKHDGPAFWHPLKVSKEIIEREIQRLSEAPPPEDGRRSSSIVHPCSKAPGLGLAPGIDVTINVLNPGESTRPIRRNSNQVEICIRGAGVVSAGGHKLRLEKWDVCNIPSMRAYAHTNDGNDVWVRLTYSNAPLLAKLGIHYVEENPVEHRPREGAGANSRTIAALCTGYRTRCPHSRIQARGCVDTNS